MSHRALLVPGQGSQFVGMGEFLIQEFPQSKKIFEEASDAIGVDIKKLCFAGPETDLALTHNTQPAILTVAAAVFEVLRTETQLDFKYTAGHSVGEYGALSFSEVISFSESIRSVRLRGQLMQSSVPVGVGGMAAVLGLADEQVSELCRVTLKTIFEASSQKLILSPANLNAPGQVVISGHLSALEFLKTNVKSEMFPEALRKAKLIPLNVSAPFHCELMKIAEEKMADYLKSVQFKNAGKAVVQNFTALGETDSFLIKQNLIKQVSGAVRWTDSVLELKKLGTTQMIECGAGKVLTGLIKKIDSALEVLCTGTLDDLKNTIARIQQGAL